MAPKKFGTKKKNFNRSKALTNLVSREKLTPHLIKGTMEDFEWSYEYEPKTSDLAWHPSGHCLPSALELYEIATQTADEREKAQEKWLTMNRTFQVGHFWHQYYQTIVQRIGLATPESIERREVKWWGECDVVEIDKSVYENGAVPNGWVAALGPQNVIKPYHAVAGHADIAPCEIPRVGEFLVDFKSMHGYDFKKATCPYPEKYEAQINIYMDLFELERGLIVGIQKDTPHNLKEFEFRRNDKLIKQIYDKWEHVSLCLEDGTPPDAKEPKLSFTGPVES